MVQFPPLESQRVRLRPFDSMDITDRYISWLNDPRVVRLSNQRFLTHTRASARAYFESFFGTPNLFIAICDSTTGTAIGTMTAYRQPQHGTVDTGIMIGDPECWGRGYGQDAWSTLTEWLIAQPKIRKLTAGTLDCNHGMIRLMQRAHMHHEATRKAQELVDGNPHDIFLYARFSSNGG